jgi:hypothetical protein
MAPPRTDARILSLSSPRADETAPTQTAPAAFRCTVTRDEKLWSREDEGAMSHCKHRNVDSDARQPGPADEAPDNSRKIPVGKREMLGSKIKNEHDPRAQFKTVSFVT